MNNQQEDEIKRFANAATLRIEALHERQNGLQDLLEKSILPKINKIEQNILRLNHNLNLLSRSIPPQTIPNMNWPGPIKPGCPTCPKCKLPIVDDVTDRFDLEVYHINFCRCEPVGLKIPLLPCPFCSYNNPRFCQSKFACINCGATGPVKNTKDEAAEYWNRRDLSIDFGKWH